MKRSKLQQTATDFTSAEFWRSSDEPIEGVQVEWNVDYDDLEHDMEITYSITADKAGVYILQVWAINMWIGGVTFPEDIPTIRAVVEFDEADKIRTFKAGLIDGKWQQKDKDELYRAGIIGYCSVDGEVTRFRYSREYQFPGWREPETR